MGLSRFPLSLEKNNSMRKYATILFVLILIGLGLSVSLFTQEQRLDPTVFLQTTESIHNLQTLDKNLSLLLNQSRYNQEFDHTQLTDTNYQISEEFDNLRYEALFEEIEGSAALSEAISDFEQQFFDREETLDDYVESNGAINESLGTIDRQTKLLANAETNQEGLQESLTSMNGEIYRLALGGKSENNQTVNSAVEAMLESAESETLENLSSYVTAFKTITELHSVSKSQFDRLEALRTGPTLDAIENEYTAYHNQAISGSNQFRNALILYGLCLLGALLFFGIQIRKNYLSLEQQVTDRTAEIKTAYNDLQESQEQLIQSEKMASLGQMVAGVAHEINTPLGYVTSNVDTVTLNVNELASLIEDLGSIVKEARSPERDNKKISQYLVETIRSYENIEAPELIGETLQLLNDGNYGLSEISKLVSSLKDFARLDRQNTEQVDIHDCLNSSLTIASNHIRENNVTVKTKYRDIPKFDCFPSKLNQLFLNIITNACQSMNDKGGKLSVHTDLIDEHIHITFTDQGIGMDEETKQHMFDPFFTTKEVGLGTGLGMSIAYKIVEAHSGSMTVNSAIGEGTSITIALPNSQSPKPTV